MHSSREMHLGLTRIIACATMHLMVSGVTGQIRQVQLFEEALPEKSIVGAVDLACKDAVFLQLDHSGIDHLLSTKPATISIALPGKAKGHRVVLEKSEFLASDFTITRTNGNRTDLPDFVHYRVHADGEHRNTGGITIFTDRIMGLIGLDGSDWVLGPVDDLQDRLHVLYKDDDLNVRNAWRCYTELEEEYEDEGTASSDGSRSVRCAHAYWEASFAMVQAIGGMGEAPSFMIGLFGMTSALFAADGIDVSLGEIFLNEAPDAFTGSSTTALLAQFDSQRPSFNGDLAMLFAPGGMGGRAYYNSLCSNQIKAMAVCSIEPYFEQLPMYSWTLEIAAHEMGHILGARHTHACVWNGDNTAIDGCGPANGFTEGNCALAPIPSAQEGGTIMSYCHLLPVGISFSAGFGEQPASRILSRVNSAACLTACGSECLPSHGLIATPYSNGTATIRWRQVGADSYDLSWKEDGAADWLTISGIVDTARSINWSSPGTLHKAQVRSHCQGESPMVSEPVYFTTPNACADTLEPNDDYATATAIELYQMVRGRIEHAADHDIFRFQVPVRGRVQIDYNESSIHLPVTLVVSDSTSTWLAALTWTGPGNNALMTDTLEPGTYHLLLRSTNGGMHPQACYSLRLFLWITCDGPPSPWLMNAGSSSAVIGLPDSSAFSQFDVYLKRAELTSWTAYSNSSPPSRTISGLTPEANYELFIRARCSSVHLGYSYSDTISFATVPDPCTSSMLLNLRTILDGPYQASSGLMSDSLRALGMVPLETPYLTMGWNVHGPYHTTPEVLAVQGPDAIVDWVVIGTSSSASYLTYTSALLQRDGDIVSVDGTSLVRICRTYDYVMYISVQHRNHLKCTSQAVYTPQNPNTTPVTYDFSSAPYVYSTSSRRNRDGVFTLWAGNASTYPNIAYIGPNNDRDAILQRLDGDPFMQLPGYHREDTNLDGVVRYIGPDNDRDVILRTLDGDPTSTRFSY